MDCKESRSILGAYVDGELDARSVLDVEDHTRACPNCSSTLVSLRGMKQVVQSATYYRAPETIVAATQAKVRTQSGSRQVWKALFFVSALCVAAIGGWMMGRRNQPPRVDANTEAVAAHLRALMANHLLDIKSSDQSVVRSWFAGKLDFVPPVDSYKADGYALMGGRMEFIDGHRSAVVIYGHKNHVIDVITYPSRENEKLTQHSERGFSAAHWASRGLDYSLVSGLNRIDLREFVDLVRANADSAR